MYVIDGCQSIVGDTVGSGPMKRLAWCDGVVGRVVWLVRGYTYHPCDGQTLEIHI